MCIFLSGSVALKSVESNAAFLACEEQRQDKFQKDSQSEWKYWYSVQAWVKQKLYLCIMAYFFYFYFLLFCLHIQIYMLVFIFIKAHTHCKNRILINVSVILGGPSFYFLAVLLFNSPFPILCQKTTQTQNPCPSVPQSHIRCVSNHCLISSCLYLSHGLCVCHRYYVWIWF